MTTTTSLLHTALQNLHVAQQVAHPSHTPRPPSSVGSSRFRNGASSGEGEGDEDEDDDDNEIVRVGLGTAPGTPMPGRGMVLGQRIKSLNSKDPLRLLPTHLAVRIFLQLDIRALARCDRVCKRWHKSSTLNYVWFLQNRALTLPMLEALGGKNRKLEDGTEFFDPYDKGGRLSSLPSVPMPKSTSPQWTKAESKRAWKSVFHTTLARTDPTHDEDDHPYRVTIDSLQSSGYNTPSRHAHAGLGSGGAGRWQEPAGTGALTPGERKIAAREGYKALGGRKSRAKRKMGGEFGARDKGGATVLEDDARFTCPW